MNERCIVGLIWVLALSVASDLEYKSLMGLPAEFAQHAVPSPYDAAVSSRSLLFQLSSLSSEYNKYFGVFDVDSTKAFTMTLITAYQQTMSQLKVTVRDPAGEVVLPDLTTDEFVALDGLRYPALTFLYLKPSCGKWVVEVKNTQTTNETMNVTPVPIILLGFSDSVFLHATLNTNSLVVGETISLDAVVTDENGLGSREAGKMPKRALNAVINSCIWTIKFPDGEQRKESLYPVNYLNQSGALGDINSFGYFQASFIPSVAGTYISWVECQGQVQVNGGQDIPYTRTAYRLISVADNSVRLTGKASVSFASQGNCLYLSVHIGLQQSSALKKRYRVYGEVWGHSLDGNSDSDIAIGWISGLSDVVVDSSLGHAVSLKLDLSLTLKARAFPTSLHRVRLDDLTAYIPVTTKDEITIDLGGDVVLELQKQVSGNKTVVSCIDQLLRPTKNVSSKAASGRRLILVHGYCSSRHSFPESDFADSAFFEDFGQSRSNDEFARLIYEFGEQFDSYGLAGHSHGGIASLHLYTYYKSGVDYANGERLVQSVGTPYHGSPLADLLALIGQLLGIGCGPNPDLAYDSMERWLAAIPADKQKALHYYTSQYHTGGLLDYCLLPSNFVLSLPNDGVVENSKTSVPFGNNEGNSLGECHTTMMRWPPQMSNANRNAIINSSAAR